MGPERDRARPGLQTCRRAVVAGVALMCCASAGLAQAPKALVSKPGQTSLRQANLPAGVYEVTFRLQTDKQERSVTPLATLSVGVSGYPNVIYKQITPIHFGAANTPTDFTFRFDNFKTQDVQAVVALAKNKDPVPKLSVATIGIVPSATPCIGTVWPGKILYYTREDAKGFVTVYNGSADPQTVTLRCVLESDLEKVRPLKKERLTLAPGERRNVPVAWNTGTEEYGHALAATLLDAKGKPIGQARQYFSVADNLWKVGITERGRGTTAPHGPGPNEAKPVRWVKEQEALLAAELAKPFAPVYWSYANYVEYSFGSPDSFFLQAPDVDYWYAGMGNYTMGKRWLQMSIEWLHRRGMRATSYVLPSSCGYGGEEVFRKHPEWFTYDKSGRLGIGSYYQKLLEVGSTVGGPGTEDLWKLTKICGNALWLCPNIANLETIDAFVDQVVKAHKMLGWDGIRFDVYVFNAAGYDFYGNRIVEDNDPKKKGELEVRAWAHMRDSLWKKIGPNFVIGVNYDYELRDMHPAAWVEACRKGQLMMEEIPRNCTSPQSARNPWREFMAYYHGVGDIVRELGGHHLIIGFDKQHPVDQLYLNVFTYAMRAHPFCYQYRSDTLPLGNYAQFTTRYSALVWDIDRVKPLPEPGKKITVASATPVWWKELACVRQAPNGKRQYIVHLINPPAQERIYTDATNKVRAPASRVRVTLNTGADEKISRAYILSADPVTHQRQKRVTPGNGQVSVTVPRLHFWSIVVFE